MTDTRHLYGMKVLKGLWQLWDYHAESDRKLPSEIQSNHVVWADSTGSTPGGRPDFKRAGPPVRSWMMAARDVRVWRVEGPTRVRSKSNPHTKGVCVESIKNLCNNRYPSLGP